MLGKTAVGATVVAGTLIGALQYDIHEGKEAVAHSQPSMELVYEASNPEYSDSATIILPGFGTRSAEYAAKKLPAHAETGQVFALEYSNKDVDIDELTQTVVKGLKESAENGTPIRYINFDGLSAGGVVALAIAATIHENYPEFTILPTILDSTPIGEHGLSQESDQSIEVVGSAIEFCNRVKLCEGIEYSRAVHYLVEIASRHGNYYNSETHSFSVGGFHQSVSLVDKKLSGDDAPSLILAYNQTSALEGASNTLIRDAQENFYVEHGVEQSIATLSKPQAGKPPVKIFYTMSEDASKDGVVNVEESSKALQAIAEKYGMNVEIVPLDVGHVDLYQTSGEYNDFIKTQVGPLIEDTIAAQEAHVVWPEGFIEAYATLRS